MSDSRSAHDVAAGPLGAEAVSGVVAVLSSHASFAMQMRRAGFEVVEGRDIDDLARTAPTADVVVVDLVAVEGKRGLVARLSTAVDPRVPVVLISADDVDVALLGTSRPVHVVVPPVRADDVVACVRQVLLTTPRASGSGDGANPQPAGPARTPANVTPLRPRRRLLGATRTSGPTAGAAPATRSTRSTASNPSNPSPASTAAPAAPARPAARPSAPATAAPSTRASVKAAAAPAVVDVSTLPPPVLDWRVVANQMAGAVQGVPTAPSVAQALADDLALTAGADVAVVIRDPGGRWVVEGGVGLRAFEWAQTLEDADWLVQAGREEHLSLMIRNTDVVRGDLVGAPLASRHQMVRTHAAKAPFFVCAAWPDDGDEKERVSHVVLALRRHEHALADAVELRTFARWLNARVEDGPESAEQP